MLRELYLDWCKEETMNSGLEDKGGVKLALDLLVEVDPLEYESVKSESIDGITQTFDTNSKGIPNKVLTWLSPYYLVGSL